MNFNNETSLKFIDTLDYLQVDCRSGYPERALNCQVNTALGVVTGIILPFFIVSGLVGNALIAYINLCKQPVWTRQNVYLSMIALADNCNIFMNGFMWMYIAKGLPWLSNGTAGYFHLNSSDLACKIARYLELTCTFVSSSLFLLMVADRTLSLFLPFRFKTISGRSALKAGLITVIACLLVSVPNAVVYKWIYSDGYVVCYRDLTGWQNTAYFYYAGMLFYPPTLVLALILIFNIFLIYQVRRIIKKASELQEDSRTSSSSLVNTVVCLTLSAVLLTSSLPVVVSTIVQFMLRQLNLEVNSQTMFLLWAVNDFGITLIVMNQCTNWAYLFWKNKQFRTQFIGIFSFTRMNNSGTGTS